MRGPFLFSLFSAFSHSSIFSSDGDGELAEKKWKEWLLFFRPSMQCFSGKL